MNCQRRWPGKTPDMQTKFMLLFFGHKCLPFYLTWQEWVSTGEKRKKKEKEKRKEERVPLRETER